MNTMEYAKNLRHVRKEHTLSVRCGIKHYRHYLLWVLHNLQEVGGIIPIMQVKNWSWEKPYLPRAKHPGSVHTHLIDITSSYILVFSIQLNLRPGWVQRAFDNSVPVLLCPKAYAIFSLLTARCPVLAFLFWLSQSLVLLKLPNLKKLALSRLGTQGLSFAKELNSDCTCLWNAICQPWGPYTSLQ